MYIYIYIYISVCVCIYIYIPASLHPELEALTPKAGSMQVPYAIHIQRT